MEELRGSGRGREEGMVRKVAHAEEHTKTLHGVKGKHGQNVVRKNTC